jgi:hypothetical protein
LTAFKHGRGETSRAIEAGLDACRSVYVRGDRYGVGHLVLAVLDGL